MAVRLVLFTSQAVASPNQWRFEAGCGLSSAAASSRATENEAAEASRRGDRQPWLRFTAPLIPSRFMNQPHPTQRQRSCAELATRSKSNSQPHLGPVLANARPRPLNRLDRYRKWRD